MVVEIKIDRERESPHFPVGQEKLRKDDADSRFNKPQFGVAEPGLIARPHALRQSFEGDEAVATVTALLSCDARHMLVRSQ